MAFSRLLIATLIGLAWAPNARAQSLLRLGASSSSGPTVLEADGGGCTRDACDVQGHVSVITGSTVLSADALHIDFFEEDGRRKVKHAVASGNVLLIDNNVITVCDRVDLESDLVKATLSLAEIHVKKTLPPGGYHGFAALGQGRDALLLTGHIERTGPRTFHVHDAYFTPCDCGNAPPTFSIKAKEAWIDIDSHATFYRPVFQPVDVALPFPFSLPAMYVPLGKRKTGFIMPSFGVQGGFFLEESFFWAAHRDFDFTATANLTFRTYHDTTKNADTTYAIARPGVEFRYAPDGIIQSRLLAQYAYDPVYAKLQQDSLKAMRGVPGFENYNEPAGPDRLAFSLDHVSDAQGRWPLRVNAKLISDPAYLSDYSNVIEARVTQYVPSRAAFDYRGNDWRLSLGVAYFQNLIGRPLFGEDAQKQWHRLPDLGVFLAPTALGGGVFFALEGRLSVASNLAPGAASPIDARVDWVPGGTPNPPCPDSGRFNDIPCVQPNRLGRVELMPRLTRPLALGPIDVAPELIGNVSASLNGLEPRPTPHGFAALRVDVGTHLGRVFQVNDGLKLRHRIRPLLQYLLLPATFGALNAYALDERDYFRPTHQLAAGFDTDLFRKEGGGTARRTVTLALRQYANLGSVGAPRSIGEMTARLEFNLAPATVAFYGSYDHKRGILTERSVNFSLSDARKNGLSLSYYQLLGGGSTRTNTGLFELAPGGALPRLGMVDGTHSLELAATLAPWSGLILSYRNTFSLARSNAEPLISLAAQRASIAYRSPCECFGVALQGTFPSNVFQIDPTTKTTVAPLIDFQLFVGDAAFGVK